MSHDSTPTHDHHGTEGAFIGWVAIGLLALMAVFAITVVAAGAMYGFS